MSVGVRRGRSSRVFVAMCAAMCVLGSLSVATVAGAGSAYAATTPTYYPSGPQVSVNQSALTGWTPCYNDLYNANMEAALPTILTQCTGTYLLLAGGPTNSTVFDVVAAAPRADVLFDTGINANVTHNANGSEWYFNAHYSWGFAKGGDTVFKSECDTSSADGQYRLCWHTVDNGAGGYRSGTTTGLNNSTSYRRVIYQSDGNQCAAGLIAHLLSASTNAGPVTGLFCVNLQGIGTYTQDGRIAPAQIIKAGNILWFQANGNNLRNSGYLNTTNGASSFVQTKPTSASGKVTSLT